MQGDTYNFFFLQNLIFNVQGICGENFCVSSIFFFLKNKNMQLLEQPSLGSSSVGLSSTLFNNSSILCIF